MDVGLAQRSLFNPTRVLFHRECPPQHSTQILVELLRRRSTRPSPPFRRIRFAYKTHSETKVLDFEQATTSEKSDFFGAALERIIAQLTRRMVKQTQEGKPLCGIGWNLCHNQLTIGTGASHKRIRVTEFSAVDWVDNAVCVWVPGDSNAILRRDATSPGATVLYRVLKELISQPRRLNPSRGISRASESPPGYQDEELVAASLLTEGDAPSPSSEMSFPIPGTGTSSEEAEEVTDIVTTGPRDYA